MAATSLTGQRDHQALYDLETAHKGFKAAKDDKGERVLSDAACLRLGVYWALLNSGLGYTPESAKASLDRLMA